MLSLILSRPLTSALAALALLFAVLWGVQSFRAAHLKERVETAEARELGAKVQAQLSDKVRTITETLHTRETIITERADNAADQIASRGDGRDPLPVGLRDDLVRAIRMLREPGAPTANPGAGDPAGGVSEAPGGGSDGR